MIRMMYWYKQECEFLSFTREQSELFSGQLFSLKNLREQGPDIYVANQIMLLKAQKDM
jgi:hypothetical protein